jgi:hypothetical protein
MLKLYLQVAAISDDSSGRSCFVRNREHLNQEIPDHCLTPGPEKFYFRPWKALAWSLRSGGATAAANAGLSDRLFKKHGRWCSDNAKDGYVHENLHYILSV